MILTCPNCATRYQTDVTQFAAPGRNVRCAKCGQVWFQAPPEPEAEAEPELQYEEVHEHSGMAVGMAGAGVSAGDMAEERAIRVPARERPAAKRAGSRTGRILGWAVLIVIVIAIIFALLNYRETIATLWPKSASMYAALGMKVNVLGLDLRDIAPGQTLEAGQPTLEVKGRIVNITDHKIPVPQVRVALIDGQSRELYHWVFDSGVGTLDPGATDNFTTRLPSPPREARNVSVRFVEAGEQ